LANLPALVLAEFFGWLQIAPRLAITQALGALGNAHTRKARSYPHSVNVVLGCASQRTNKE